MTWKLIITNSAISGLTRVDRQEDPHLPLDQLKEEQGEIEDFNCDTLNLSSLQNAYDVLSAIKEVTLEESQ